MGWVQDSLQAAKAQIVAFASWCWHERTLGRTPWLRRTAAIVFFLLLPAPVLFLLFFRFVPVPITPEMILHLATLRPVRQDWRSFDQLPTSLTRAVIGAEDQNFCRHRGFDWKSIDDALRSHIRHPRKTLRGASTISQQTARTLFLVSARSWVRKGVEAYLTVLIEALWPKKRILTAYLNLVDWGHGNFGAEAASQAYFHKSASRLSLAESARLATILPNPDEWRASQPGPYVSGRSQLLVSRSAAVLRDGLDWCVRK